MTRRACLAALFFLLCLLPACRPAATPTPLPVTPPHPNIRVVTQTAPPAPTPAVTPVASQPFTPTLAVTAMPSALEGLTIDELSARSYGGGRLVIESLDQENIYYSRYMISYPSDDLTIHGFIAIPRGMGPFPVVIVLHGWVNPAIYEALDYTTAYANHLARDGFLVIHPNMRGYGLSNSGPNLFGVGYAIDVLNLVALVKAQAGQEGPLALADPNRIGVWGHSVGGGVAIRAITVSPDIKAAVLYGSMSADERKNADRNYNYFTYQTRSWMEMLVSDEVTAKISPVFYLDRIRAAVSIHHGEADEAVPVEWSEDLCERLQALGKTVECFTYPGQPHILEREDDLLFEKRVLEFYRRFLQ